uniref:C2 domain-containing protein n=1 Tax=Trieres chinensis TaxID=1514140 RepID=A0A7S1YTB7_TRICV|mmetsp:Transcript_10248/g.21576  ORF Transcript_10248/g.21576 Transcript_10248/m.21576 type:complete len:214 (+) Transcript_10248:41-682(+)
MILHEWQATIVTVITDESRDDYSEISGIEVSINELKSEHSEDAKTSKGFFPKPRRDSVPIVPPNGTLQLQIRGLGIKNIETGRLGLGVIDPYFELRRLRIDHQSKSKRWEVVYTSEVIKNHRNPFWDEVSIDLKDLCDHDVMKPMRVLVHDWGRWGSRIIGSFETNVAELMDHVAIRGNADWERSFPIYGFNTKKKKLELRGRVCVLTANVIV